MAASLPRDLQEDALTGLTTTLAATSKLHLFTNQPNLTRDSILADFTPATFTGSTAKTVAVWSAPFNDPTDGLLKVRGEAVPFIASAVAVPETIRGWYLTDMAGTGYEGAGYLPAPVEIAAVGDGVEVEPVIEATAFGAP
jgi:hypothetical protein